MMLARQGKRSLLWQLKRVQTSTHLSAPSKHTRCQSTAVDTTEAEGAIGHIFVFSLPVMPLNSFQVVKVQLM